MSRLIAVAKYSNDATQQGRTESIHWRLWQPLYGPCVTLEHSLQPAGIKRSSTSPSYPVLGYGKCFCFCVLSSSNPLINHTIKEKLLLLFTPNTNIFTLHDKQLKADGKSFIFVAVCHKRTLFNIFVNS